MCYAARMTPDVEAMVDELGIDYKEAFRRLVVPWRALTESSTAAGSVARPYGFSEVPIVGKAGRIEIGKWTYMDARIKDPRDAQPSKTANCRSEHMFSSPFWRNAAVERRILVACDEYIEYQWRWVPSKNGGTKIIKIPFGFHRPDNKPFWMGGLCRYWTYPSKDPDNPDRPEGFWTFTICTMPPNKLASWIHNSPESYEGPRQPVSIRSLEQARAWIGGGDFETVEDILEVKDDGFLVANITRGVTGKFPDQIPDEPEGRPAGVV